MKHGQRALAIAIFALAIGVASADDHESLTFTGTYDWSDGDIGNLTAEFKSNGEGTWTVQFDFDWNGQDHTWTGTAKGSLEDGTEVTGTATDGKRHWVFDGGIKDGVLSGRHREIREGRDPYESGTFEIKR